MRNQWREVAAGTNINNLKRGDLLFTEIPLPPRAEQNRIVTAIEEHFSRIDTVQVAVETARQKLGSLRRSVLSCAFSNNLVCQDLDYEPASALLSLIAAHR